MLKMSAVAGALIWSVAAFAMPAAAATVPATSTPRSDADHVDPADCDEIGLEGRALTVNGVRLTHDQMAAMDLADGPIAFAAEATGAPGLDACIDVANLSGLPVANGHAHLCGPVDVDVEIGFSPYTYAHVGGVPIRDWISTVDTVDVLEAAAAGGVDACISVVIVDNRSMIEVTPERVCGTATLLVGYDRWLRVTVGSTTLTLGENSVTDITFRDPRGLLAEDKPADVCLWLVATSDRHDHSGTFTITVGNETDDLESLLPDAAMSSDESPLTTIGLVLLALAIAWAMSRREGMRT